MNLKELLGDAFKENMTLSDIETALKDRKLVDSSTLPESVSKETYNKVSTEAANLRKQLKEKMTAEEQAKAEQDTFKQQLADLQKENQQMKLKDSFVGNGYDAKTAASLAEAYSSGDMAKFASLNAAYMTEQQKTIAAKVKEDLLKNTPGIGAGHNQQITDFSKQIEEARNNGNMPLVASLIRQQAEAQSAAGEQK